MELLSKRSFVKSSIPAEEVETNVFSNKRSNTENQIQKRAIQAVRTELAEAQDDIARMDYTIQNTWEQLKVAKDKNRSA